MKKFLINSGLSVLFTLVIVSSLLCLTVLNDNFVIKVLKNNEYYSDVYKDINVRLKSDKISCNIDKKSIENDINKYVKSYYRIDKVKINNDCKDIYKEYIRVSSIDKFNMKKVYYITFIITIILVIIVGSIFIRTGNVHNLDNIVMMSSILMILIYGGIYIFVGTNMDIVNKVIDSANHLMLAVAIILFEIIVFKKIKSKVSK